jgi:hypothetical protein
MQQEDALRILALGKVIRLLKKTNLARINEYMRLPGINIEIDNFIDYQYYLVFINWIQI